ncbi:MAG: HRDC domain-containing protein [Saprospiraceae bacterium]
MNIKLFQTRLDDKHIQQDQDAINTFMESVTVKKTATQFVIGQPDFWSVLVFYENGKAHKNGSKESDKISFDAEVELTEEEKQIFVALKQWRRDRAKEVNVPEYLVCHNAELITVSKTRPRSMEDLNKIKGFGDQKISKYGDDIIAVVNAF